MSCFLYTCSSCPPFRDARPALTLAATPLRPLYRIFATTPLRPLNRKTKVLPRSFPLRQLFRDNSTAANLSQQHCVGHSTAIVPLQQSVFRSMSLKRQSAMRNHPSGRKECPRDLTASLPTIYLAGHSEAPTIRHEIVLPGVATCHPRSFSPSCQTYVLCPPESKEDLSNLYKPRVSDCRLQSKKLGITRRHGPTHDTSIWKRPWTGPCRPVPQRVDARTPQPH